MCLFLRSYEGLQIMYCIGSFSCLVIFDIKLSGLWQRQIGPKQTKTSATLASKAHDTQMQGQHFSISRTRTRLIEKA